MDVIQLNNSSVLPLPEKAGLDLAFPSMRYLGSKRRFLPHIFHVTKGIKFRAPLDLYCGTGSVSWLFKVMGKTVVANDALKFPVTVTQAILSDPFSRKQLTALDGLSTLKGVSGIATKYYNGIFFEESDCEFLDAVTAEVRNLPPNLANFARAALAMAALKKRPRGLFTQAHHRPTRQAVGSNENLPIRLLYKNTLISLSEALVGGSAARVSNLDSSQIDATGIDLLYLDPPYPSKCSDANYLRRYHFLEGLCRGWQDVEIDFSTSTRQVRVDYPRIDDPSIAIYSLRSSLEKYPKATWLLSLNSNSTLDLQTVDSIFRGYGRSCKVFKIPTVASVGTRKILPGQLNNRVDELLFLGEVKK